MVDLYIEKEYTVAELAYLAGIIDGEGCVYIGDPVVNKITQERRFQTMIKVSSTDEILIDWLMAHFGGLRGKYTPNQKAKNCRHDVYFWQVTGKRLTHICEVVLPYVITKKRQLEIMIKIRATFTGVAKKGKKGIQPRDPVVEAYRRELKLELRSIHTRKGYRSSNTCPVSPST